MTALADLPRLTLYHFPSCFFCVRVTRALAELDLEIELRDIRIDQQARAELVDARGRATVPVLRIEREGKIHWMPESSDIVDYLRELAANR